MKSTTKSTFKTDVLDSKKVVLLDVWAPWCGPCKGMAPIVEALAEETKEWADVVKLDASVEMDLAQEVGVSGLPTFLVFKNGITVDSMSGITTKEKLKEMMAKNAW